MHGSDQLDVQVGRNANAPNLFQYTWPVILPDAVPPGTGNIESLGVQEQLSKSGGNTMKHFLTTLALAAACTGASAMGAPGGLTGAGYAVQPVAMTAAEQRAQFRCEQTRSQIDDVLKHKPQTQADQDSVKSLHDMERVTCIPPLIQPPASAATRPAAYPMQSMRARHQGIVIVKAQIAADGSVANDSLYRSSGYSELDHSALEAVKGWQFDEQKGSTVRVPVTFSMSR